MMNDPNEDVPSYGTLTLTDPELPAMDGEESIAEINTSPQIQAALTISSSLEDAAGKELGQLLVGLQADVDELATGSLEGGERMALMQAKTLDLVFHKLVRSAFCHRETYMFPLLMRLAFRAQAQSARTLETLVALKKPPLFAQQVNMANQQVVSNHLSRPAAAMPPQSTDPQFARASDKQKTVRSAQNRKSTRPSHANE